MTESNKETNEQIVEEQSEMYEHHRIVADKGQSPLRIDKFLLYHIANASRNKIQQAARAGNVLVNGKVVKQNFKVKPDDVVSVVMTYPPREVEIIPENIPLDIVYEDDDIVVVNKPSGMVVHPGFGNFTGTLLNALAYYFEQTGATVDNKHGYLCHRIDKDTTGLLLIAKNEIAQAIMAKQFYDHTIDRKYNALVWGDFEDDEGTIEGHIGRDIRNRKRMSVYPDGEYGKEAITHFNVVQRFGYITLVECKLETGRTHQIRAHFKYIQHPLFNDVTYGGDQILKGTTFSKYKQFVNNCFKMIPRQSLHARSLGFVHPTTKKDMFFESEFPQDMKSVIDKWEAYVETRNME
ncbi:MAG: RluA family pseudouridine synthase [Bacteroidales bacterium]